ncbi:MAG: glycosyltransferase [Bifidobacterium sp.]|uniref:glycosyltransferase n=1 Tax=Bifidobacterium sp. TaxID=41200 RepID=UPI00257A2365|nr:glycosyltransferase [Bifidobacterium sp.]MBS5402042.1 glycosyltransferase [Bifidobacterium sp.]
MDNKITVIIPVYNAYKTILRCVNSVNRSTYSNIEIIVIDDGSNEKTKKICDEISSLHNNIKVIHQDNLGVSAARNKGIENATGKYIAFIDADDTISPKMLTVLAKKCETEKADIAICGYEEVCGNYSRTISPSAESEILLQPNILKVFLTENIIGWNVWAKLYRRDVIGNTRFQNGKKIAEDMYFNYEVLKKAKKVFLTEKTLYSYIKNNESAMSTGDSEKYFDTIDLVNKVYNDTNIDNSHKSDLYHFYVKYNLWFLRFITSKAYTSLDKKRIEETKKSLLSNVDASQFTLRKREVAEIASMRYMPHIYKLLTLVWRKKIDYSNIRKRDLNQILRDEKHLYPNSWFDNISFNQRVYNWRFLKLVRKCEFYRLKSSISMNPMWKAMYWISRARKNRLGVFIGVEIPENVFLKGLTIHHNGNIVINGGSTVGGNCQLHGDNCIGNSGKANELTACPIIGNNVDIGVGAKIIGDVIIADDIKIGANAVVTKSFLEPGITLVGIPAHKLQKD